MAGHLWPGDPVGGGCRALRATGKVVESSWLAPHYSEAHQALSEPPSVVTPALVAPPGEDCWNTVHTAVVQWSKGGALVGVFVLWETSWAGGLTRVEALGAGAFSPPPWPGSFRLLDQYCGCLGDCFCPTPNIGSQVALGLGPLLELY
ncbi:hypothetical protein NDU88_007913 [Pleurodeles waltl]|uniref:Uncharacterized protein n=1 Tax=Pleurodeles waltl TaxID=8319 RepID=A0AAV7NBK1_PLEWA|nr:hypothetical protein NDU88_007913 [Pleurodeles waltl]